MNAVVVAVAVAAVCALVALVSVVALALRRRLGRAVGALAAPPSLFGVVAAAVVGVAGCDGGREPGDPADAGVVDGDACAGDADCADDEVCAPGGACLACPAGSLACRCAAAGGGEGGASCAPGLGCDVDSGRCVALDCPAGTIGCPCGPGGACANDGERPAQCDASLGGVCRIVVDDSAVPGLPQLGCYTPCENGIIDASGVFRPCSAEGLMEGCIGLQGCVNGSCVGPDAAPPTCTSADECPAHQTCIDGGCFSNCADDGDCAAGGAGGAVCSRAVCRLPCVLEDVNPCSDGFRCETDDGVQGVCAPVGRPRAQASTALPGDELVLSAQSLSFTNTRTGGVITLENPGSAERTFTVRKVEEVRFDAGGRVVVTDNPLFWLRIGQAGAASAVDEVEISVPAGGARTLEVSGARNDSLLRWEGRLEVRTGGAAGKTVLLEYSASPAGQWSGSLHTFIHFDDFDIDDWLAAKDGPLSTWQAAAIRTKNALLIKWTDFRGLPTFTLDEWRAVLQSTKTESWAFGGVQAGCDGGRQCYLFADGSPDDTGLRVYTDNIGERRIPRGVLSMPITLHIRDTEDPLRFDGRVQSPDALQYPGLPPATLRFGADPATCASVDGAACIVPVAGLDVEVVLGGRSLREPDAGCSGTLAPSDTPWLVLDFLQGTAVNDDDGRRYRQECREAGFPFDAQQGGALAQARNQSAAAANPIPDGRERRRTLELLDGVMVNADSMMLLVRERFDANLGPGTEAASYAAYGVIELRKTDIELQTDDLTPGVVPDPAPAAEPLLAQRCDPELALEAIGASQVSEQNAGKLSRVLIEGIDVQAAPAPSYVDPALHALCHDTGRFDGGFAVWEAEGRREACPVASGVTFFFYDGALALREHACNGSLADHCPDGDCQAGGAPGTCADLLDDLAAGGVVQLNPPWACTFDGATPDFDTIDCNNDRQNLPADKLFFRVSSAAPFTPLRAAVDEAFRYKTRFKTRNGTNLGFVPEICALDSDVIPYCYDPTAIEELRERVDCLIDLFGTFTTTFPPATAGGRMTVDDRLRLRRVLEGELSFIVEGAGAAPLDGFERLYSELLIMKGDDALTQALGARFDLAGGAIALFEGDLFEPGGVRLSGGAGFEMNLLYEATQYYQLVLDRFARTTPALWRGIADDTKNFLTLDSIATYFNRVILASTKRTEAMSEIALRYVALNRPDLARRVIERSYAQAYLESVAISQLMRRSVAVLDAAEIDGLEAELLRAQRRYRVSLERMREAYQGISDDVTFFGDAPDFVSFPQVAGAFEQNAVQTMIDRANDTLRIAKEREERALATRRAFDTDQAQFQSELSRLSTSFENELGELCGLFEASDGNVYPAIPKYAPLHGLHGLRGDPCGLVGNGGIHDAIGELDGTGLELELAVQQVRDLIAEVAIEEARVNAECNARVALADIQLEAAGEVITIQGTISALQQAIGEWNKKLSMLDRVRNLIGSTIATTASTAQAVTTCSGIPPNPNGCMANLTAAGVSTAAIVIDGIVLADQIKANNDIRAKEVAIANNEAAIAQLQAGAAFRQAIGECCLDEGLAPDEPALACENPGPLVINAEARIQTLLLGLKRAELGALRAELAVELARGRIQLLRNKATRLIAQQQDAEELLIDVEGAKNDPNVRLLKNSDIIDADKSFHDALVDAHRATRVFEYFTGQSYAKREALFLARLAGRGENNIENYLIDLLRDFRDFQEEFGSPAPRAIILSLKDDIFRIPTLAADGRALSASERTELLRDRLADPALLDARGYISIPFATTLEMTSPLTALHKLDAVEVEMLGSGFGDRVANVYLTARGTGSVRTLDDDVVFHRFPPITAVINPFFQSKPLDPAIYRSTRFRDRPFVNTTWELGFNQRDELVNQDLELGALDDLRVYFFFEDFTGVE